MIIKSFEPILKKQFSIIGLKYDKSKVKHKEWYLKHSWSKDKEDKFKEWLIKWLVKKYKVTKKYASSSADWWCFDYGWTYTETDDVFEPLPKNVNKTKKSWAI